MVLNVSDTSLESEMETEVNHYSTRGYNSKRALQCAIQDWIPELYKTKTTGKPPTKSRSNATKCDTDSKMEVDSENASPRKSSKTAKKTTNAKPTKSATDKDKSRCSQ